MAEVGILEAKNRLAVMIDKAARGEDIIITRRGKPVAKLVAATPIVRKSSARSNASKSPRSAAKAPRNRAQADGAFAWDEWKKRRDKEWKKERG